MISTKNQNKEVNNNFFYFHYIDLFNRMNTKTFKYPLNTYLCK